MMLITDFVYLEIGIVWQGLVPQVGAEEGGLRLPQLALILLVLEGVLIVHRLACNKHVSHSSPASTTLRPSPVGPTPHTTMATQGITAIAEHKR